MSQIIDISRTLKRGMPVWPGDTEFQPLWVARMENGDSYNLGGVTMSLHTGTHSDAPLHFLRDGTSIADMDLSVYIGLAQVIDLIGAKSVETEHVLPLAPTLPERILFKTHVSPVEQFGPDFAYISPEAARILAGSGIKLVGIDTPSVDSSHSKTMETHKILAASGIAILEHLNLANVAAGQYELIALPLKLAGMEGSPVRAVLRTL
jgi:arylformamidase